MFHYYQKSYFSIRKIKNKLHQKGFDQKTIDDFILNQLQEDPDFEVKILKKYIQKKKIGSLEVSQLKKKLYQQSFNENSIYKIINE
jgi:SOS response regulatory protein OraA/RecX